MIYAISTDTDEVCPHFGRAPEFTIVTIENNEIIEKKIYQNPGHQVGSIPKFINEIGAKCMITGGMGHRAIQFFHEYGIEVIMGVSGSIDEVIQKILAGTLEAGESACTPGGGKGYGVEKIHTEADEGHHHHVH